MQSAGLSVAVAALSLALLVACQPSVAAEQSPVRATAIPAVVPPLPAKHLHAPQKVATAATIPPSSVAANGETAPTATVLAGDLGLRATAVREALAGKKAAAPPEDSHRAALIAVLEAHGVVAKGSTDTVDVPACAVSMAPAARLGCAIDRLVWFQHVMIDGAALGARSQPLPPHRKRLTRKEKTAAAADAQRRRDRAVRHVVAAFDQGRISHHVDAWLNDAGPGKWPVYRALKRGLQRYERLAAAGVPKLADGFPVAAKWAHRRRTERRDWLRAMTDAHRQALRLRLCAEGYCAPATPPVAATVPRPGADNVANVGSAKKKRRKRSRTKPPARPLDAELRKQLATWQANRGLRPSGVVNKPTRMALDVPMTSRVAQIRLAMQRIRDTEIAATEDFLVANIPAFRLDIFRQRKLSSSHLTQVGKGIKKVRRTVRGRKRWLWVPGMRTPQVSSTLRYLVVDPEWVVPSSIRREYRFKIAADPDWPAKNGFEMRPASNGGNYMVMKSGEKNLLGRVKFLFPNTHLVYLHDTPKQRGFKYPVRLRSHGCVRVERAGELARTLLTADRGKRWSEKKWEKYLEDNDDKWLRLKKPLAVHLVYWTADATDDGRVRFYRDVYKYDARDQRKTIDVARAGLDGLHGAAKSMPAGPANPASPRPTNK